MAMPQTRADRQARREQIRAQYLAKASRVGVTLVCAAGANHTHCHGATVCLCECHDPDEETP